MNFYLHAVMLNFESWRTNILYLDFGPKPAVFGCFTNTIAPPPIALKSCSMAQTDWPVFSLHSKKIFLNSLWVTS